MFEGHADPKSSLPGTPPKFLKPRRAECFSGTCSYLNPREAVVILPRVFEQHRIGEFRADADLLRHKDEVGHLRKTTSRRDDVTALQDNVSILENGPNQLRVCHEQILPWQGLPRTGTTAQDAMALDVGSPQWR